ncbi:MAG: hypothetical protein ACTSU7_12740 [Candidatus Heimdallarchaeaceae archaeon]
MTEVRATPSPTNLSPANGTLTNDNTPFFDWTDVTGNDNYNIQITTDITFAVIERNTILSGNSPSSFTQPSALPDDVYYWRVRSYDSAAGGWSDPSTAWSITIDTVAPAAPTLVDPSNFEWINDNTPYFDWNPVAGCNIYDFKISVNPDLSAPIYGIGIIGGTGITPFMTFPDGLYYWGVAATDGVNWGPYSTSWGVHIDTVPPAATTLVSPANGFVSNTQVTLECSIASGANLYIFEIATDPAFGILDLVYSGGTSSRTHTTNEADGFYYWRVKTKDSAQNIAYSATRTFTIDTIGPSAPTLVGPTHNTYTTDTTPYLDWNVAATAVSYQVQVDTSISFSAPVVDTTTANSYYTTPTLTEDSYYWRVRSKDSADNWGSWSSSWSFTIDTTAPSAPTLKSPENSFETNDDTPYLDWREVLDAFEYQVQVDTSDSFPSPIIYVGGTVNSYYQISSSLSDDDYFWRVRCVDLAGNVGDWSAVRSFTIDTIGPFAPLLVSPDDSETLTDTTPLLLWNTVTDGVDYQLQIDISGTFVSFEYNITTVNTFYTIPVDLSDGSYYWRVRAMDSAANWGSWSTIWSFTIDLEGPDAPVLNTPSNGAIINDDTPYLEWIALGDAVEYEIELATSAAFGGTILYSTTTSNNYYTIFFSISDDVYYWRVRAKDAADNWGDWSTVWSFTVDTVSPNIVSPDDILYQVGNTGNNFSWFPKDDNPSSYVVYLNDVILFSGTWNTSSEEIFIDVDGYGIGTYNFTLYFEDASGKSNTDTVFVTVTEVIPEYGLTIPLTLLPVIFIGIILIRKRRK